MPNISIDDSIKDLFSIELKSGGRVEFQFPPRVAGDSRTANFDEAFIRGTEPNAIFQGSGSRQLTLEWTYIVGHGNWDIAKVADALSTIRSYFYFGIGKQDANAIVLVKLASHGAREPMSMRIHDLQIKHGSAYVKDNQEAIPLRSDVSVTLKTWTQGGQPQADKKQNVKGLIPELTGRWV